MPPQNLMRAAALIIFAEFLFAAMGAIVKALSSLLPNTSIVFFRNGVSLILLLPWLIRGGSVMTSRFDLHLLRGLAGVGAMYCFFYALAHIHFAEAVLLKLTAPLFIPLIALGWLREALSLRVVVAVLIGFVGVALIFRPGFASLSPAVLVGLSGGALAGLAQTTVRRLSNSEPEVRIVFYFSAISTLVSAVPLCWHWITPAPALWGMLLLLGALGAAGQIFMTHAFALAPAARVGVYGYTSVVFASGLGWMLWGEIVDGLTVGGAGLILMAGLLAVHRQQARKTRKYCLIHLA